MAEYKEKKESKIKVVYRFEDVFREAARELVTCRDWKFLGRRLGLEEADLMELIQLYDREGRRETIYQMLCQWRQRNGKEATLPKLARYLREEQLHATADLVALYQVREECTRCFGTGHRLCRHEKIPSHLVRSNTSLNLNRKKIITNYPVLPNIKSITPRIDSGMRGRQRRSSAGSTQSTPRTSPTPRFRSVSMEFNYPSDTTPPLPPITPDSPTDTVFNDEAPGTLREQEPNEANDNEDVHETVFHDEIGENDVENDEEKPTHTESSEPSVAEEIPQTEPESLASSPSDDGSPTSDTRLVNPVDDEKTSGYSTDGSSSPSGKTEGEVADEDKSPSEPTETICVTARVNVTEIQPVEPNLSNVPIPNSIAEMFKSMALHLYQTIVKNKEDHATALQSILELRDFLVKNIVIGSIVLEMECYTQACYEQLRDKYRSGKLWQACDEVFNRNEVLEPCGIKSIKLDVEIAAFDELNYEKEETPLELTLDLEDSSQSVIVKDRDETKRTRRKSSEVHATVDMKARVQAQVHLDLNRVTNSSVSQSTLDDKLRLGKARSFHKLISSPEYHRKIIENLNSVNKLNNITYKSIMPKGDIAELTVTCSSAKAIQDFYDLFLRRDLKKILGKVLLTRSILREAGLDDVTIDVDVDTEHVARCQKRFEEALVAARGSRYD